MYFQSYSHPELVKKFPTEVKILFEIFGTQIRLVGGCVRDLLLGKQINDFDFATKTLPAQTIEILEKNNIKAVPTGVKFGTITAVVNGKNFEITTLRKDNETDGRHCAPEFVDDFYFDAARRDFTINALYLDSTGLVTDYFDGISDLQSQKVRFIGDAKIRIEEDYLRILRFFRFSCEYSKNLDHEGLQACTLQKENLKKLSRERIRAEFHKILMSKNHNNLLTILEVLQNQRIITVILSSTFDIKAFGQLLDLEEKLNFSVSFVLKMATILSPQNLYNQQILKEICATNLEKKQLEFFAKNYSKNPTNIKYYKALMACDFSRDFVTELYLLKCSKGSENIVAIERNYLELQTFIIPQFPVVSQDLIQLGYIGKDLGDELKRLKDVWINSDFSVKKSDLLNMLK